jgi:Flp pilus assembly protein CpaB
MRLLVPNIQVLRAATTGGGLGGGNQTGNIVLALTDLQAGKLAFASENGKIWLSLRPGNAASTPPTFETLGSILTGSTPIQSPALDKLIQQIVARGQQ